MPGSTEPQSIPGEIGWSTTLMTGWKPSSTAASITGNSSSTIGPTISSRLPRGRNNQSLLAAALGEQPLGKHGLRIGPFPHVVIDPGVLGGDRMTAGFATRGHAGAR